MSLKKTALVLVCVLALVTVYTALTAGGSMDIALGDDAISFSGVRDYVREIRYEDILSARLVELSDPGTAVGGFSSGKYRCGTWESPELGAIEAFITVKCETCVLLRLTNGESFIFNYNDSSSTKGVYELLLRNL